MDTDNPWTKSETFAWNEGRRIVDLFELSKQLLCKRCEALLDLRRIEREDRFGFASVLYVPCVCGVTNELHTSRKQEPSSPSNPMYEVNIKASISEFRKAILLLIIWKYFVHYYYCIHIFSQLNLHRFTYSLGAIAVLISCGSGA